ncbi:MAG: creatininase family protein, partial [Bacillota bacterium]
MNGNRYLMKEMSWPEVDEALDKVKVAIIPVGSHEQHGPNVAESCDSLRAEKFAELLAERLYPEVMVTPTVNYGVSPHHMNFPGTLSLTPDTLIWVLTDIVRSLYQHGLDKIIIFNSHGGNQAPIGVAIEEIREELDVRLATLMHTDFIEETISDLVASDITGHACEFEVSEMLYLDPEKVKKDSLTPGEITDFGRYYMNTKASIGADFDEITKNGALGDATLASREMGEKIITAGLDEVEKFIREFMELA